MSKPVGRSNRRRPVNALEGAAAAGFAAAAVEGLKGREDPYNPQLHTPSLFATFR